MRVARDRYWGLLLAGGYGERLWPWSRRACPKSFLTVTGGRSLLQASYDRLRALVPSDQIFVIGLAEHARLIRQQLPTLLRRRWVGEPVSRNTAAAVGVGTLLIGQEDPGAVAFVVTADHIIRPTARWVACLKAAAELAIEDVDRLVCFGIRPSAPTTGYGYLIPGSGRRRLRAGLWAAPLARYVEKPAPALAQLLIRQGALWNSGMFVWSIAAIARALQRCMPKLTRGLVQTIRAQVGTPAFDRQLKQLYRGLPSVSIDCGVMEQTPDRWMIPATFTWDDVGSWASLLKYLPSDAKGNAVAGPHVGFETENTLVFGESGHLVATVGVRDLVIAHWRGVTLVARRAQAQRVRELVGACRKERRWNRFL